MREPVRPAPRFVSFFVAGVARPTQPGPIFRGKGGKGIIFTWRNTEWAATVGKVARDHAPEFPFAGPVRVDVTFYFPTPAKHGRYHAKRPDLFNMDKKMFDSLNHVLWEDDGQIVEGHLYKEFSEREPQGRAGVLIRVTELALPEERKTKRKRVSR